MFEILVSLQEGQKRLEGTVRQTQTDIGTLKAVVGTLESNFGSLNTNVQILTTDVAVLKTTTSHIETAVESLAEGQKDIRKSVVKQITNHERRLTNGEETAHSHKN